MMIWLLTSISEDVIFKCGFAMMPPTKDRIAKVASSLKTGYFDFEVIAPFRTECPFWTCLEKLHGTSVESLGNPHMWQFSLALANVFDIELADAVKCLSITPLVDLPTTESEWINALRRFKCTLQDVPEAERTFSVCRQAIKNNPREFYYVPEQMKSQELCVIAMKKEPVMLFFLPLHLQSKALYRKAVRKDGKLLTSVPIAYRCEEIYLAAVRQNGLSIEFISPLEITPKVAREAVRSNGEALKHVPFHLVTKSLCDEAIRCEPFGAALPFVPAAYRTERMILRVLKSMPMALRHIPAEQQSELVRLAAVSSDGMAIQHIPMSQQTEEICHKALTNNIHCWKYVNHSYRISGLLLSVKMRHNRKYPKDIQDAVTKLVGKKCELSQLMAKAYLSQLEARDVAQQIGPTIRRIVALAEIFDGRTLAEIYQHNYKIRAAIFRHSLGM